MSEQTPRIVIIGGVAGGASAATRARRMNEHAPITVFEKDPYVSFANCGLPYYVGGEIADRQKLLVATPQLLHRRYNLDVRVRHEVLSIDRARRCLKVRNLETGDEFEHAYDKLILAPGASPIIPPLPGVEAPNVFSLRNLPDADRLKAFIDGHPAARAVVVGAGFIGLEMVEMFRRLGLGVTLVELLNQVLPPLDPEMARLVEQELVKHQVELCLGNGLKAFELESGMVRQVVLSDGARLQADLVLLGMGVRPNIALAKSAGLELGASGGIKVNQYLQTSDPDIYAVGDAVEYRHAVADMLMRVPLAGPANRAGRLAGEHAATGRSPAMPAVLGTAIVRVFDQTAAVTGCNRRCTDMLPREVRSLYVTANHHAGYYPGAQPMTIKLTYEPASRRVLGAQIVGGAGVDTRINVLATLIQMQATVDDLTELDLAYAPPFGAAKDPLHMAGFAARNHLDGLVAIAPPAADLGADQVVDVRSAQEVATQPLLGVADVKHIPLEELRQRLGELDPRKATVVTCASGMRGYVAARLLEQNGFARVSNLTGGAVMRRHALAKPLPPTAS